MKKEKGEQEKVKEEEEEEIIIWLLVLRFAAIQVPDKLIKC